MIQKTTIHGFDVSYEENAEEGMKYLRDHLDINESKVFFDEAKKKGSAEFEDDDDRQFTLVFQKEDDYVIVRR